jgi:integrase
MQNVLDKYGNDSMEYLIISLYDENTLRDDYHELLIIQSEREINPDVKANYLINPRGKTIQCKIVIQNYKIAKKNGEFRATLSKSLTKLIRAYIEKYELTDKLFPNYYKKGLSSVVSGMSKQQGILKSGGTNYLRHSKVSTLLNSMNVSPEERARLSTSMTHSVNIQAEYNRILKI